MYYVYQIRFPELNAIYVGCTNNLRRRKDQHNENARLRKSYLGTFLARENIVLTEDSLQVIGEYECRADALRQERETALSYRDTDIHLLNDVYSNHSTRKGKKGADNPSAKTYIVADTVDREWYLVEDMHGWCAEHPRTSYKTLIGTAKRKPLMHAGRYIARLKDEWDAMSQEERDDLLSGKWYRDTRDKSEASRISKQVGVYLVKTPGGFMFVKNLDKFARDHGINEGNLHASLATGRSAQGYKVVEKIA